MSELIRATPCDNCPWRAKYQDDGDYLRPGRRGSILAGLRTGGFFPCHKTTVAVDDEDDFTDMVRTVDSVECAGAVLMMLREQDAPFVVRLAQADWVTEFIDRNADVELWSYDDVAADSAVEDDGDDMTRGLG